MTVWPSGLRRWLQAPVRKGVGSNPTAVIFQPNSVRPYLSDTLVGQRLLPKGYQRSGAALCFDLLHEHKIHPHTYACLPNVKAVQSQTTS